MEPHFSEVVMVISNSNEALQLPFQLPKLEVALQIEIRITISNYNETFHGQYAENFLLK